MLKKIFLFTVYCLLFTVFLSSCGNGNNDQQTSSTDTATASSANDTGKVDDLTQFKYDKLISNIPIPFDILRVHAEVPLIYNAGAVNPTSNLPYYSSSISKALNLGIYGGDLAYSITYEKFEDMGKYLKCAKKLADDLGIPLAFDQQALGTYKKYGTNKDSLEKIVFASYSEVDNTLKSNERIGLASLVVTGGWLEGIYATLTSLGTIPRTEKSQVLYKKIWEQKNHLNMIIELLSQFNEDVNYVSLVTDLNGIKSIYDGLSVKSDINETEVASLAQKVGEVRAKIIAH
ncbi:MAG: hypothetical protein HY841_07835 [Bacteroidetes bacterium]|nr:hypothetical protein [Bacteroidota bacterium]